MRRRPHWLTSTRPPIRPATSTGSTPARRRTTRRPSPGSSTAPPPAPVRALPAARRGRCGGPPRGPPGARAAGPGRLPRGLGGAAPAPPAGALIGPELEGAPPFGGPWVAELFRRPGDDLRGTGR